MDRLMSGSDAREAFINRMRVEAFAQRDKARDGATTHASAATISAVKSEHVDIPLPPFLGATTIQDVDLRELWPCFDLKSLYRLSWGASNTKGEAFDALVRDEFDPRLRAYQHEAQQGGLLHPKIAYGYYPAAGVGNDVILYDPADASREIARFPFARQVGGDHLCLADIYASRRAAAALMSSRFRSSPSDALRPSVSTHFKRVATTANPISYMALPCSRPRRWRNGPIVAFAPNFVSTTTAVNAIRGVTARVPTSRNTRSPLQCWAPKSASVWS